MVCNRKPNKFDLYIMTNFSWSWLRDRQVKKTREETTDSDLLFKMLLTYFKGLKFSC